MIRKYRPEIDGLRALSVLAVILFHAELGFSGGYVGVDVFFVISGYLITGILVREFDEERFSFEGFWKRRIKRILPVSAFVILITFIVGYLLIDPLSLRDLGKSIFAQSLFSSNIYFWSDSGYFAGEALTKPLLHTWSLAIEEQFYLIFPFILYYILKNHKQKLLTILVTITAVSFLLNCVVVSFDQNSAFYLLPFRAWELSIGACLACLKSDEKISKQKNEILSVLGLFLIVYSMLTYTSWLPFPGYFAFVPVFGAVMYIFANSGEPTLSGRLLSHKIIVYIGLISYSLYLWHWPVFSYIYSMGFWDNLSVKLLSLVLIFALSILSYYFIEQYFRSKERFSSKKIVFGSFAGATLLVFCIGYVTSKTDGYMFRFDAEYQVMAYAAELDGEDDEPISAARGKEFGVVCHEWKPKRIDDEKESYDFAFLGDSHGFVLEQMLNELSCEFDLEGISFAYSGGCPIPNLRRPNRMKGNLTVLKRNQEITEKLQRLDISNVIIAGRWAAMTDGDIYVEEDPWGEKGKYGPIVSNKELPSKTAKDGTESLLEEMAKFVVLLQEAGYTVWVMKQVPETNDKNAVENFLKSKRFPTLFEYDQTTIHRSVYHQRQENASKVLSEVEKLGVNIIDPSDRFFNSDDLLVVYDEESYYRDDDHLTSYGVNQLLKPVFRPVFETIKADQVEPVSIAE